MSLELDRICNESNLFEIGPAVLFVWKNHAGWPVEEVSSNVYALLGYTKQQFESGQITYVSLLHPDESSRIESELEKALSSGKHKFNHENYRLKTAKENYIWVKAYTRIIKNNEGNITHFVGYLIDVDQQTRSAKQYQDLSDEYETIFNNTDDVMFLLVVNEKGDFYFNRVNSAFSEVSGISSDAAIGKTPVGVFGKSLGSDLEIQLKKCLDTQVFVNFESSSELRNVTHIWNTRLTPVFDPDNKIVKIVGNSRNITNLKMSEYKHSTIIETTADGFWMIDITGRLVEVNDAYCRMTGFGREELLEMYVQDIEVAEKAEETEGHRKRIIQEGADQFETIHKTKDGGTIDVEVTITFNDFGGGHFFAFVRDITERKRIEKLVRENEERLGLAVQGAEAAIWDWNIDSGETFFDAGWYEILRYEPDELIMTINTWETLIHPDDLKNVMGTLQKHLKGKIEIFRVEHRMKRKGGEYIWILDVGKVVERDKRGNAVRLTGMIQDITERKRAELERLYLASIVESSDDAIISITLDGMVNQWNQSAEKLYGFVASELIGEPIFIIIPDDKAEEMKKIIVSAIEGKSFEHLETVRMRKDGKLIDISLTISPIRDTEGKVIGITTIGRDISEQKERQRQLEWLSISDPLTQIYNRLKFDREYHNEIIRARRYKHFLSLVMFDIDHFKKINDNYGHDKGDMVLVELSRRVKHCIRDCDIFARWGGEEFMILCVETDLEGAVNLAERIHSSLCEVKFDKVGKITASFGVTAYHLDDKTGDMALKRVDEALYRAKENGRNRIEVID